MADFGTTETLDEHAPRVDVSTNPADYTPTPEEKKALKLAQRIFEKSKKAREKYDQPWPERYKFFRGKQWKEQRPSYRHSEVINMTFQSIQATIPIMTDSRPRLEFAPRDPSDLELSEILNDVLECDWEQGNWDEVLVENILEAHLYSVGLGYVGYDPKANYGEGAVELLSWDPFYFYPDPNSRDVNKKARHITYAEPVDVEVLKIEYPDKAKWIKADLQDFLTDFKTELDEIHFKSPVDNKTLIDTHEKVDTGSNKALKVTVWMKSDEITEEKESKGVNKDTGLEEFLYTQKLRYPNGRKICYTGNVLLDDTGNFEDGLFPAARLINYVLPREFYGISDIEQEEGPQRTFNKLVSFALDVLTLMGNPVWVVDDTSGIDTDNLFNRPGLVLEKNKDSSVQRLEGVQLQPFVLQLIDRMRDWFDGISGAREVTQGVQPTGVSAASAIMSLQDAAQTRVRLKSRNLDQYLRQIGELYLNRVFEFYSAPRVFRVSNNPNAQKYFKFHVKTTQDETGAPQKTAVVTPIGQDAQTGQPVEQEPREYLIRGGFDVKVNTGTGLPFAKAQKFDRSMALFKAGALDELELLKDADYPNYEAVYERVQARKAQAAQAEMMAKAGGAPPAPGGQPQPPLPPA